MYVRDLHVFIIFTEVFRKLKAHLGSLLQYIYEGKVTTVMFSESQRNTAAKSHLFEGGIKNIRARLWLLNVSSASLTCWGVGWWILWPFPWLALLAIALEQHFLENGVYRGGKREGEAGLGLGSFNRRSGFPTVNTTLYFKSFIWRTFGT